MGRKPKLRYYVDLDVYYSGPEVHEPGEIEPDIEEHFQFFTIKNMSEFILSKNDSWDWDEYPSINTNNDLLVSTWTPPKISEYDKKCKIDRYKIQISKSDDWSLNNMELRELNTLLGIQSSAYKASYAKN